MAGLLAAFFLFREPDPGPSIQAGTFSSLPLHPAPLPDRWIPRKWGWLWRTKEFLLGRRKVVMVEAKVLTLGHDQSSVDIPGIPGRAPEFTGEYNTRFWLLSSNELAVIKRKPALSGGAITLAEKSQGQMMTSRQLYPGFASSPSSGLLLEVYPLIHPHAISLSAAVSYSQFLTNGETIITCTNLALSGRFQIPDGSGLLILSAPSEQTNASRVGFLLVPSLPAKPKH